MWSKTPHAGRHKEVESKIFHVPRSMIASVIRYCQVERWKRESSQFEDMHPKSERESIPFHFYGAKITFNRCWRSLFTLSVAAAVWLVRFTPHSKLLRLPKTNSGKQCLLVIMPPWQFAFLSFLLDITLTRLGHHCHCCFSSRCSQQKSPRTMEKKRNCFSLAHSQRRLLNVRKHFCFRSTTTHPHLAVWA